MDDQRIKEMVRKGYSEIASGERSCCGPQSSCCGGYSAQEASGNIGYSQDDMSSVPEGANLGLGCGNPIALASLKAGETVLDLGSGAGFDCFLAAERVGDTGHVIGVDMTPEMISSARNNIASGQYENVEFRLGEIEHLPVSDSSVDAIISNCVINLSTDKRQVFTESYRVLKPGGRLIISDIVLLAELPQIVRDSVEAYIGCLSGALLKDAYVGLIRDAGFHDVTVLEETPFPLENITNDPHLKSIVEDSGISFGTLGEISASIVSIKVTGIKA